MVAACRPPILGIWIVCFISFSFSGVPVLRVPVAVRASPFELRRDDGQRESLACSRNSCVCSLARPHARSSEAFVASCSWRAVAAVELRPDSFVRRRAPDDSKAVLPLFALCTMSGQATAAQGTTIVRIIVRCPVCCPCTVARAPPRPASYQEATRSSVGRFQDYSSVPE